jgi:hypothetical protein
MAVAVLLGYIRSAKFRVRARPSGRFSGARPPSFPSLSMKILLCVSKVPDTTTKIQFTDNGTKFDESGVQFIANPYDEWYALVRAVELKESLGGEVTVINVGPAANEQVIRKCLAIGADKAIRVDAEPTDALPDRGAGPGLRPHPARQGNHRLQRFRAGRHAGRTARPALRFAVLQAGS